MHFSPQANQPWFWQRQNLRWNWKELTSGQRVRVAQPAGSLQVRCVYLRFNWL
jgi:hypothetical protein